LKARRVPIDADAAGALTSADLPPLKKKRIFQEVIIEPAVPKNVLEDALKNMMKNFAYLVTPIASSVKTASTSETAPSEPPQEPQEEPEPQHRKEKEPMISEEAAKKQQIAYNNFVRMKRIIDSLKAILKVPEQDLVKEVQRMSDILDDILQLESRGYYFRELQRAEEASMPSFGT
jgi:hypothetical protein